MNNYLDLLEHVIENGVRGSNRTGVDTISTIGETLRFDLREGFPAPTTKQLAFKNVVGELIGFLRGSRSLAEFKALGCNVWDQNVNDPKWQNSKHCQGPDDMGRIYGTQWRDWPAVKYVMDEDLELTMFRESIDQLQVALDTIRNNPESRRIIVNTWNPAELDQACLPPCHYSFQFIARNDGTLHMIVNMRSVDVFLGMPFNIASYALMLHLFAAWTGRQAATMTMNYADTHVYVNHLEQAEEQLSRMPGPAPSLIMTVPTGAQTMSVDALIKLLQPDDFELVEYNPQPAIKAPMAV